MLLLKLFLLCISIIFNVELLLFNCSVIVLWLLLHC